MSESSSFRQRASVTPLITPPRLQPASLRQPLSPLVGREEAISELRTQLCDRGIRLLTLHGPGGVGKSRLAIETALSLQKLNRFEVIAVVSLADIDCAGQVLATIAEALGMTTLSTDQFEEHFVSKLHDISILLIVNNLEHLPASGVVMTKLLQRCPKLSVLATSRALLDIEGETVFAVEPLSLPPIRSGLSASQVVASEAGRMLEQRANAAIPGFQVTNANADDISRLCHWLEGSPFGIELAARRLRLLTPRLLLDRMENQLAMLSGGPHDLPPRLREARASVAWSLQPVSLQAKEALKILSVFSGGFTLDAANSVVVEVMPELSEELIDLLQELQAHSLLSVLRQSATIQRFTMPEIVRQYMIQRLQESQMEHCARSAHAGWFSDLSTQFGVTERIAGDERRVNKWFPEVRNITQAAYWMLENDKVHEAEVIVARYGDLWWHVNQLETGLHLYLSLFELNPDLTSDARGRNLAWAGLFSTFRNEMADAVHYVNASIKMARTIGDHQLMTLAQCFAGQVASYNNDHETAVARQLAAVEAANQTDSIDARSMATTNLAAAEVRAGLYESADSHARQGLALSRQRGSKRQEMFNLITLGYVALTAEDREEFQRFGLDALQICVELEDSAFVAESLLLIASFAEQNGHLLDAARILSAALNMRDQTGRWFFRHHTRYQILEERLLARLSHSEWERTRREGELASIDEAAAAAERVAMLSMHDASPDTAGDGLLTHREIEVLGLIAAGLTDKQIADRLAISPKTASNHASNIITKLNAHSRSGAAVTAYRLGIIS